MKKPLTAENPVPDPDDPRPDWEAEDREMDGSKPDLEEIEEDPSGFE